MDTFFVFEEKALKQVKDYLLSASDLLLSVFILCTKLVV